MAIKVNTNTKELIFCFGRDVRHACYQFTNILKDHNGPVEKSIGRRGNCQDNVVFGLFFKSIKLNGYTNTITHL